MERRAPRRELGLTLRMAVVTAVILVLYLAIFAYSVDVLVAAPRDPRAWLFPPFVLLAIAIFIGSAASAALSAARARKVSRKDAPDLHQMVERLCALAELPKPRLAIGELPAPNAFTVGVLRSTSTIAVASSLFDALEPKEIEAVVAHELGHVAHRDAAVVTAASLFPIVGAFLGRWRFGARDYTKRKRDWREYFVWPFEMVLAVTLYLLGSMLTLAISRYREFDADRFSAVVTGTPEHLMSALQKLDGATGAIPHRDLRSGAGLNALFIVPMRRLRWEITMDHPPLEKRLAQLSTIAREMGEPAGT